MRLVPSYDYIGIPKILMDTVMPWRWPITNNITA